MIMILLALLPILTLPGQAEVRTLTGAFIDIEMGDYAHLLLEDAEGEQRSFFVSNDSSFDPFLEDPAKFKGRTITITWQSVTRTIPEAGGDMEIEEAVSIKLGEP